MGEAGDAAVEEEDTITLVEGVTTKVRTRNPGMITLDSPTSSRILPMQAPILPRMAMVTINRPSGPLNMDDSLIRMLPLRSRQRIIIQTMLLLSTTPRANIPSSLRTTLHSPMELLLIRAVIQLLHRHNPIGMVKPSQVDLTRVTMMLQALAHTMEVPRLVHMMLLRSHRPLATRNRTPKTLESLIIRLLNHTLTLDLLRHLELAITMRMDSSLAGGAVGIGMERVDEVDIKEIAIAVTSHSAMRTTITKRRMHRQLARRRSGRRIHWG